MAELETNQNIAPEVQQPSGGGDPRKNLYNALSKEFNLGSYEEFNTKMDSPESRRKLYDHVSKTKNIGTFEEFDGKVGKGIPQVGGSSLSVSPSKQKGTSTSSASGVQPQRAGSGISGTGSVDLNRIGAQLNPANRKTIVDQTGRQVTYDPTKQSIFVDPRTGQAQVEDTPRDFVKKQVNKEVLAKAKAPKRVIEATKAEDTLSPAHQAVTEAMLLGADYEGAKKSNQLDTDAMAAAVDSAALANVREMKLHPYRDQTIGQLVDDKGFMGAPAVSTEVDQRRAEDTTTLNTIYGDLSKYGIDAQDFNGYLNSTNPRVKKLFEEGIIDAEGGRNSLALDNEKFKAISNYFVDRGKYLTTLREGLQYRASQGDDVQRELGEVNSELSSLRQNLINFSNVELPYLNDFVAKEKADMKKDYEKLASGDKSWFESSTDAGTEVLEGAYDALVSTAATVSDAFGLDTTAENLRVHRELNEMKWSNPLYYGYASGKKVTYKGKEYLVDPETGFIGDLSTKKNVSFIADEIGINKEKIYEAARQSTQNDFSFSAAGAAYQSANVLGNLAVQILGAKGVGAAMEGIGMSSTAVANSMITTGGYIYSNTYEDTLQTLRDQGMQEKEATKYANDVANVTAVVGALTSVFSPNINAQALFTKGGLRGVIREGIESLDDIGRKGFLTKVKDRVVSVLTKGLPEGVGEAIQENLEYGAQQLASAAVNKVEGKQVLNEDIKASDIINNAVMSFGAAGLMAGANSIRTMDKLDIMNKLATDYSSFDSQLSDYVQKGYTTEAKADALRKQVDDFRKFKDRLPEGLPSQSILPTTELLSEKEALETKKKSVDKVFHEGIDKQIEAIDAKIKETISKPDTDEGINANNEQEGTVSSAEGSSKGETSEVLRGDGQSSQAVQDEVTPAAQVYNNSKELSSIGSMDEYNKYLSTVFPDTKVRDILFHGSKEKFDTFKPNASDSSIYFSNSKDLASTYGGELYSAMLNINNDYQVEGNNSSYFKVPLDKNLILKKVNSDIDDLLENRDSYKSQFFDSPSEAEVDEYNRLFSKFKEDQEGLSSDEKYELYLKLIEDMSSLTGDPRGVKAPTTSTDRILQLLKGEVDSVIFKNIVDKGAGSDYDYSQNTPEMSNNVFTVFSPDQVHVLGSKKDVEGFKKWKQSNEQITEESRPAIPAAKPESAAKAGGEGTSQAGAGKSKSGDASPVEEPTQKVTPEAKIEVVDTDKGTLGESFKRMANDTKGMYYSVSKKALKLRDIKLRLKDAVKQGALSTSKAAQLVNAAIAVDPTNETQVDKFFERFGKAMALAEKGQNLKQLKVDVKRVKTNVRTKLNRFGNDVRKMVNLKVENLPEDAFEEYSNVMGMLAKAKDIDMNRVNQLWDTVRDSYMAQEEQRYNDKLQSTPAVKDKLVDEVLLADAKDNLSYDRENFNEYENAIIKRFKNIPTQWLTENLSKADLRKATVALQGVGDGVLLNKTLNNITDRYVAQEASKSIESKASENISYASGLGTSVSQTISSLFKSKTDPNSRGFSAAIADVMLQHVDMAIKGMKGTPIYDEVIHPITSSFNKAEEASNRVEKEFGQKLDMARRSREGGRLKRFVSSVGKGLNLIKGNYFYEFDVLRQLYYRQLEADANPDLKGKKVHDIKDHMDALVNSNTVSLSSLEKEVILDLYQEFSKEDGSIDTDKMWNYFTQEEKDVIDYERQTVANMEQLSREVNDHRKGQSLQYINDYFPRKNDGDTFNDELDIANNLAGFLGTTSVKAGASNARTNLARPLDFKTSRNFLTHVREGNMEYELSDDVKRSGMILTNLTKSENDGIVRMAQALQGSVKLLIDAQFNRNPYTEDSAANRVFRALVKNTANKMLIDPLRGIIDTVGNWGTFHTAYADRSAEMARASKVMSKDFIAETLFKDFGSTQSDRLMGGQGVDYRQGITSKTGEKKFSKYQPSVFDNFIDLMRHNTITDFSQKVAQLQYAIADRPASLLWRMEFVDRFKSITGKDFSMEKYNSDPEYKIDNEAAIKSAISRADKSTSNLFNTATRAEQKLKVQASNSWWVKNFDSFMRSFNFNENKVLWDSIYSVFGKGSMSREDALRAFFIVNARSIAYSFAMQSAVIAVATLLSGSDDDEEVYQKAYDRAMANHGMLALIGNKGTTANIVMGMGIEYVRAQMMEAEGKKYNPYKDALLYVPPTRGNIDQYVGMMGAEGATLKSMYDFTKAGSKFLEKVDNGEEITNEDLIEIKAYQAFWSLTSQFTGLPVDRMSKVAQKTAEAKLKMQEAPKSTGVSQEKIDQMIKNANRALQ